jgi:hypothetical protein
MSGSDWEGVHIKEQKRPGSVEVEERKGRRMPNEAVPFPTMYVDLKSSKGGRGSLYGRGDWGIALS